MLARCDGPHLPDHRRRRRGHTRRLAVVTDNKLMQHPLYPSRRQITVSFLIVRLLPGRLYRGQPLVRRRPAQNDLTTKENDSTVPTERSNALVRIGFAIILVIFVAYRDRQPSPRHRSPARTRCCQCQRAAINANAPRRCSMSAGHSVAEVDDEAPQRGATDRPKPNTCVLYGFPAAFGRRRAPTITLAISICRAA